MRPTTLVFALLAAVATASPWQPHGHQPHQHQSICTSTKYKGTVTKTKYTSTTTETSTITTGTATTTTTSTSTSIPTILTCSTPAAVVSKRDNSGYRGCWTTTTVTRPSTTTLSTVKTKTTSTTVASTTVTITSVATVTGSVNTFLGPFQIYDTAATTNNYFDITTDSNSDFYVTEGSDADQEYVLTAGAITTAFENVGLTLSTSPTLAGTDNLDADTVFAFLGTSITPSDAASLSCSITQNEDGSCPLTCTGNGGSQFFTCSDDSNNAVQIGEEGGDCATVDAYTEVTPFVISVLGECRRSLDGRSC